MIKINGIATSAIIFNTKTTTNSVDDYALAQIHNLCDNDAFAGCRIRVMPDVHPGKVGTIGFTSTLREKILPNVIGIDIGCGMTLAKIKGKVKEFQKLDTVIRDNVPSGFSVRTKPHHKALDFDLERLRCFRNIQENKARLSLGTLGSGNHFIEVDQDEDKNSYLVIHSGSRHLGQEVTEHYLREGSRVLKEQSYRESKEQISREVTVHSPSIPYELTYLEGELMKDYLHDLAIVQEYAELNREIMVREIFSGMKWKVLDIFSCIHNYVDFGYEVPILRKGAISARNGERVIIPINMRDGIILGTGLGNKEWNYSAPHGAGRIMKREEVRSSYTVSSYKSAMKGIYSSCIGSGTLDEAPFAYRGLEEIKEAITDTVRIEKIIRPIYNFKAGEKI